MENSSSALPAITSLLLLLPALGFCQKGEEAPAQLTDPDMVAQVQQVDDENLEAAVFGSKKEIDRGLGYVQGFLHSSRGYIAPVVSDVLMLVKAGPDGVHPLQDDLDTLGLSAQLLESKTAMVKEKAAAASLPFPELDAEQLFLKRSGYRPKDRERDLRRAESDLGKADKKGKKDKSANATPEEKALLFALNDYVSEFINAHGVTVEILQRLHEEAPADKAGQLALQGLKGRVQLMDGDIANLGREIKMLQISFQMKGHQRAAFDAQR